MQTVHVRVTDSVTHRPTPVRLSITGLEGIYFAPFGHQVEFATGRGEDVGRNLRLGSDRFAIIDGGCEVRLPANVPFQVAIEKGPEYRPIHREVTMSDGQLTLRFEMERWADLRAEGWLSGDGRAHFLPPHAAWLEAAAEDLAVVNLLAEPVLLPSQDGTLYPTVPNLAAFSGQRPCLERDGHSLAVGTHNAHPVLGRLALWNCHRVVYPLNFGGPDDPDDWTLADWCQQCHRKRGLVVWTDFFDCSAGHDGEALADLILGNIDAMELPSSRSLPPGGGGLGWGEATARLHDYYRLWSAGFGKPLVGSSAKSDNRTPLGALRTYAQVMPSEANTFTAFVEAIRAGRTFITNGPLMTFSVNDQLPGATIDLPTAGSVRVRAAVRSAVPVDQWELLVGGTVIAQASATKRSEPPFTAAIDLELPVTSSTWLAARCRGAALSPLDRRSPLFAHATPIAIRVAGQPLRSSEGAAWLRENLHKARAWAEREGRFVTPLGRERMIHVFDRAEQATVR